jgi:uncharacterized protein (DUF433 family)
VGQPKTVERVEGVCGGEPVIAGTRITVNHIHQCFTKLLWDVNKILSAYPHLAKQQVMDAVKYARQNPWCLHDEGDL